MGVASSRPGYKSGYVIGYYRTRDIVGPVQVKNKKNMNKNGHPTNFPPAERVDPTSGAVVNGDVLRPAGGEKSSGLISGHSAKAARRPRTAPPPSFLAHLLDVCEPEYQAAASVVLMTTSTGTRSATASLAALIVRRIPLPACAQCSDS